MRIPLICFVVLALSVIVKGAYVNEDADGDDGYEYVTEDDLDAESVDDIIVNATENIKEFDFFYSPNSFDPKKSLIKVEYDMVFTAEEWEERNSNPRSKRTAAIRNGVQGGYRWTNNHIPYQITSGVFNSNQRSEILGAMRDWSKYTCLTFSQASQGNRILFNNGGGCYSRVGMVGGAQTVGLAWNCRVKHVVTHEVGHAIGLHHEQTRPDRDQYVRIIPQNIPDQVEYNFKKYSWQVIQQLGIPYDYLSIMHYGARAFSFNGGVTIQTVNSKYQNIIGRRQRLSFRDIKTVNIMYKCREVNKCSLKDSDCPGEGFVGKDCKCWCPGDPYVVCKPNGKTGGTTEGNTKGTTEGNTKGTTEGKTKGTTEGETGGKTKTGCYDRHTKCSYWARYKQCYASYAYMSVYCKKSCNLCGGGTVSSCRDYHTYCPAWSRYGYCNAYSYRNYMRTNCQKSCGLCSSNSRSDGGCSDYDSFCTTLANNGHCTRSKGFMESKCRKACNLCNSASQGDGSPCVDQNQYCKSWANSGECAKNPNYMLVYCKKSCNVKNC